MSHESAKFWDRRAQENGKVRQRLQTCMYLYLQVFPLCYWKGLHNGDQVLLTTDWINFILLPISFLTEWSQTPLLFWRPKLFANYRGGNPPQTTMEMFVLNSDSLKLNQLVPNETPFGSRLAKEGEAQLELRLSCSSYYSLTIVN